MRPVIILVFVIVSSTPAFAAPSAQAWERERIIRADSEKLKSVKAQIGDFSRLLKTATANTMTLQQQVGAAEAVVAERSSRIQPLMQQKAALDAQVDAHNSRCPGGTSQDQGLVDSCNAEAADLDGKEASLQSQGQAAMADLSAASAAVQALKHQQDENRDAISHYEASIASLKEAERRIEEELTGTNRQIADCEAALHEPNRDKMHEICGRAWDGNVVQAAHTPDLPPGH